MNVRTHTLIYALHKEEKAVTHFGLCKYMVLIVCMYSPTSYEFACNFSAH